MKLTIDEFYNNIPLNTVYRVLEVDKQNLLCWDTEQGILTDNSIDSLVKWLDKWLATADAHPSFDAMRQDTPHVKTMLSRLEKDERVLPADMRAKQIPMSAYEASLRERLLKLSRFSEKKFVREMGQKLAYVQSLEAQANAQTPPSLGLRP